MRQTCLALAGATLLSACGSTGPAERSISGSWVASLFVFQAPCSDLQINLRQHSETVSGTWQVNQCNDSIPVSQGLIDGTDVSDSVSVTLETFGQFSGRVSADGDTLRGTFLSEAFAFVRQH
ncbi:MAG TPA: hypothetical protein VK733_09605 [Gemmatimonadaceae bacterium]|jgi:hypothetical protein|nr:hypothetical protein [Gemmatimonadaceae bacterium]